MSERRISITEKDRDRLEALIMKRSVAVRSRALADLRAELGRASVVTPEDVPPDVVTMRSTVELMDLDIGQTEVHTLVFPEEADIDHQKISVLAPIGMAMLGCRVGDEFEWEVPMGLRRMRVSRVLYQPEAAEEWDL